MVSQQELLRNCPKMYNIFHWWDVIFYWREGSQKCFQFEFRNLCAKMDDLPGQNYTFYGFCGPTLSARLGIVCELVCLGNEDHTGKPPTHVLTPPKIGALREVARDNIVACQRGGVTIKSQQTSTGNDKTRCRNPLVLIKVDYPFYTNGVTKI